MTATLLDGRAISRQIRDEIALDVNDFLENNGTTPTLAAVLVGDDAASEVYIRNKRKACEHAGIESKLHRLPGDTSQDELLEVVARLNRDDEVHGILVQLPLPAHITESRILDAVHPLKDVDCFHPDNVGRLSQGRPRFLPCTPHGVQQLLHRSGVVVHGKEVVVVGRSEIVGKPMAMMLMQRDSECGPTAANATVTVCHSRTPNLADVTRRADVLIVAIGRAKFITGEMVKPGAAVVDVGMNRIEEGLCGDVDFEQVRQVAGHLTPVPGGVGPLTVTMLLRNTLTAAEQQLIYLTSQIDDRTP
ncbi:MAG: bifunctional methylenetetrahydrofolate dehydrogenase/methenyltetrahydrofolate cyclohydrolase FolD [Pirellulaceae bacterium]